MDREEALEELRKLYAKKDQLHSDEEGRAWLERVSGLLHHLAPALAREFDALTPIILSPVSMQTMRPTWHTIGTTVQAAIIEAERLSSRAVNEGTGVSTGPTDAERKLLQFVYDHLLRTADWPLTHLVRVNLRREGRLEDLCRQLGKDHIVCYFGTSSDDVCALRLGALEHLEGAELDAHNVLRGVAYLVDCYVNASGVPSASNRDFVTALGMTEPEARRVAAFLQYCGIWSSYSTSDVDTWGHGTLSNEILELEHVESLDGLLGQLRSRQRVLPSQEPPLAITEALVSLVDDSGMEDVPPTFWHQYGRPIAITVLGGVIAGLLLAWLV